MKTMTCKRCGKKEKLSQDMIEDWGIPKYCVSCLKYVGKPPEEKMNKLKEKKIKKNTTKYALLKMGALHGKVEILGFTPELDMPVFDKLA